MITIIRMSERPAKANERSPVGLESHGSYRGFQGKAALAFPGQGKQRVTQSWYHRRYTGLPHTGGRFIAIDDVHHHLGPLIMTHERVIVEIALLDLSAFQGNVAVERCREAKDNTALDLIANNVRIDHLAAIHSTVHPVHPDFPELNAGLNHLGHVGAKTAKQSNTTGPSFGGAAVPLGKLGNPVQHAQVSRFVVNQ